MSTFKENAKAMGLKLTDKNFKDFIELSTLLEIRNKEFNLTAIKDPDEIETKHFLDSLSIFAAMDIKRKSTVLDVGTGGGFPSLPLAIVRDDLKITALDSTEKKLVFVKEACERLNLRMNILCGRAEVLSHASSYREQFEIVTSRAVADLSALAELCLPFVEVGGKFVAYKGANAEAECDAALKNIQTMGGALDNIISYTLPGESEGRCLVVIRKAYKTPPTYPRSWAAIKRGQ